MADGTLFRQKLAELIKEHDSLWRPLESDEIKYVQGYEPLPLLDQKVEKERLRKLAICESQLLTHITIHIRKLNLSHRTDFTTPFNAVNIGEEDSLPKVEGANNIYSVAAIQGYPSPLLYLLRKGSKKLVLQSLQVLNMLRYKCHLVYDSVSDFAMCVRDNRNILTAEKAYLMHVARHDAGASFFTKLGYHFQLYAPWYRTLLGTLFALFVAALMFSPLGPMVLDSALIGAVAWVSASGATIFAGAVIAAAAGFIVATFDYVLAATLWFISEVIIGLLSLPTILFSEISRFSLRYLYAIPLPLFALPTLLFTGIIEFAEYISSAAWIHQRVMTLRNFFSKVEPDKINTDDFLYCPLDDRPLDTVFMHITHNQITYFGNVFLKRSIQENPYHKKSSEPPVVTVEDLTPSKSI